MPCVTSNLSRTSHGCITWFTSRDFPSRDLNSHHTARTKPWPILFCHSLHAHPFLIQTKPWPIHFPHGFYQTITPIYSSRGMCYFHTTLTHDLHQAMSILSTFKQWLAFIFLFSVFCFIFFILFYFYVYLLDFISVYVFY